MTALFQHQEVGARRVVSEPYLWIGDEMGNGKTLQAIEGAQRLWEAGEIDQVLVLAPSQVYRDVWADEDLGQLRDHVRVPSVVREYRPGRARGWQTGVPGEPHRLSWLVGNYELIRSRRHLAPLLEHVDARTFLVLDESLAVQGTRSATTLAVWALRQKVRHVLLLNGTEGGGDTPASLYSQAKMMSSDILSCRGFWDFRARYAKMGGFRRPQKRFLNGKWQTVRVPCEVVEWVNLDDLWGRLRPHYLRRLKSECLDLPPKLPPVAVDVPLSRGTWATYQAMRRDAVAFLAGGVVSARQAGVRGLRLAQITSGFLGGVQDLTDEGLPYGDPQTVEVGREKLEALIAWHACRLVQEPFLKLVVWCRFRAEAERATLAFKQTLPEVQVSALIGGQGREDRQRAVALLKPETTPPGPVVVVGTEGSGAFGLNQAACHTVVHLSGGFSHVIRTQTDDRPHRPGQTSPVSYFEFIATGPDGQRTVDHHVIAQLRKKQDVARWGAAEWAQALREDY